MRRPVHSAAVSAPRFFFVLVIALTAALVAAGCTVPGAGKLDGPPKDLPEVLDLVTADALTTTLLEVDPEADRWKRLEPAVGSGDENGPLAAHWGRFLGSSATPTGAAEWAGDVTGAARYTIDRETTEADDASMLWFASVRSRSKLEAWLEGNGWERAKGDLGGDRGSRFEVWLPDGDLKESADVAALGVSGDALLGARDRPALRELVAAADRYAFSDRKALAEYAVDARAASPMVVLFRTDLLRTQVRRLVEDDPAMIELVRWTTVTKLLLAARDGWFGLAPPVEGSRDSVRIVGKVDWVQGLAPDLKLGPADRDMLGEFVPEASVAVALHDPGQYLEDIANGITRGGNQFATEEDVADKDDRIELFELLEDLDGDAGFAWDARRKVFLATVMTDAKDIVERVREAFELVEVPARVDAVDGGVGVLVDPAAGDIAAWGIERGLDPIIEAGEPIDEIDDLFAPAGKPPKPPIAWLWQGGTECSGPTAGWITYDGVERLTFSFDVALSPAVAGATCPMNLYDGMRSIVADGRGWGRDVSHRPELDPEITAPTPRG